MSLMICSECSLASPGSPCTNLEADNCKYEYGNHCCCGHCPDPGWLSLTCVLNSTTGARLWQPIDLMLCPAEGCGSAGEWWKYILKNLLELNSVPQVLWHHPTTLTTTQTAFWRPSGLKWSRDWSLPYNSLHLTLNPIPPVTTTTWPSQTATGQPWWRRAVATLFLPT